MRQINKYDETFTKKEIKLIDKLIKITLKEKGFVSEEELMKALR